MKTIKSLVRPSLLSLQPYSSARDEFEAPAGIFLDANENPFGRLNRYPDPQQKSLKQQLAALKNIDAANIFIGNGSDEVIDLAFRIFCTPGKDKVIVCPPTYGMYEVSAKINAVDIISIPLNEAFQLDVERILQTDAKMIFLCSPNNPTGNHLFQLEEIIQKFPGIVFVDEAYIDFSAHPSLLPKVQQYPRLIVSQTLSKAWGSAAIRIGIAYADEAIISFYNKIKPPYNVSQLNQVAAVQALEAHELFQANLQILLAQRSWLLQQLAALPLVEKIYPTDANFILIQTQDATAVYQKLTAEGIIVRNRHAVLANCLRITVGTPAENVQLITALKKIQS